MSRGVGSEHFANPSLCRRVLCESELWRVFGGNGRYGLDEQGPTDRFLSKPENSARGWSVSSRAKTPDLEHRRCIPCGSNDSACSCSESLCWLVTPTSVMPAIRP